MEYNQHKNYVKTKIKITQNFKDQKYNLSIKLFV